MSGCSCNPTVSEATTVNEILAAYPDASALLSDLGIDTCCGGGSPLGEACADAQVPVEEVLAALGRTTAEPA